MNMTDLPNSAVIDVIGLTKTFGAFTAVDKVTFTVARGEVFGFLGPNGAGKSTTIRMLCGLLRPTGGTASVGGHDIGSEPELVRETIGYMSQRFSLYKDLTVAENLSFFGGVYGLRGARLRDRSAAVVAMADLKGMEDRPAGMLSGAHQQRLALGCAILHEPGILFLDEPTSGVDPISRRHFWDLIQDMAADGVTILVTTHFMDEAEFCGRIGFISGGRLVALDTPTRLKHDAVAEDLFELELHAFREGIEPFRHIAGAEAVTYFGSRIHMFCRRGTQTADSLKQAAGGLGYGVRSVAGIPVTLEDAFVRLAQKQQTHTTS